MYQFGPLPEKTDVTMGISFLVSQPKVSTFLKLKTTTGHGIKLFATTFHDQYFSGIYFIN
jgi:hypothetical protein